MSSRRRWLIYACSGAAVAAALTWMLWPESPFVEIARVDRGPLTVTVDEVAETRSRDRYVVTAPVSGKLHRLELREGDPVKVGQRLAVIDPVPLDERERATREAQLASARALQNEITQQVQHAEKDLQLATRERQRLESLEGRGLVATQAADQARVAESTARNDFEALRFRLQAATADVAQARAGLMQGGAGPASGRALELRAPVDSSVLRIPDRSERVVAGGATLMTLGDLRQLEVLIEMLSTQAVLVRSGMPVVLDGWGGATPLQARVTRVEPYAFTKISALGVEEKRVNVILALDQRPPSLGDGYRLTAHVVTWHAPDVLRIPAGALFRCDQDWCVYALDGSRVRRTVVEIGERNQDLAEVRKGLAVGDTVVVYPASEVADGIRVRQRVR